MKTSLGPGSRVVTDYLTKTGLQPYLDKLGFQDRRLRLHHLHRQLRPAPSARSRRPSRRTISSPPACSPATATSRRACTRTSRRTSSCRRRSSSPSPSPGRVDIDLTTEPLGHGTRWRSDVFLRDIWPTLARSAQTPWQRALSPEVFRRLYTDFASAESEVERNPRAPPATSMRGIETSTYIQEPPFFTNFSHAAAAHQRDQRRARRSASSATSVTTDHISPAGAIKKTSPAGQYLIEHGVDLRGLQQLRLAPRQRPHHDARHLRQRAHQEPDGARRRRRRDQVPARPASRCPSTTPR